jgi:hypothetical protein
LFIVWSVCGSWLARVCSFRYICWTRVIWLPLRFRVWTKSFVSGLKKYGIW